VVVSEGLTNRKPSRPARSLSMDDEDGQWASLDDPGVSVRKEGAADKMALLQRWHSLPYIYL